MIAYQSHYNQITPGYVDHDLVSRDHGNRGETSERVRNMENGYYGRTLAGLGRVEIEHGGDESYDDDKLASMEDQDDVVGSGIFDEAGSGATIHAEMGVFEDHPNLPGYISRETQFEPNESLEDLTTGGDVIAVPGGGMSYGGRLIGPGTESPQLPFRYQSALPAPEPSMPTRSVPKFAAPARNYRPEPAMLVNTTPVYRAPTLRPAAPRPKACGCYAQPPSPPRQKAGLRGLGAEAAPTNGGSSWVPFVAGGLLLGAAVAFVAGAVSSKRS